MQDQRKTKAQLIAELAARHRQLAQLETALQLGVEGTVSGSGSEFFPELCRILADSLQTKFAFVSEVADAKAKRVRLISIWAGTDYGETFEYATKDTPCESVFSQGLRMYPARVQELFPKDAWLRETRIQSYFAIPLFDSQGEPLGHMGVMHDEPMAKSAVAESMLKILAARAASELERQRGELALRRSEHRYEALINQSPDPIFVSRIDDFVFTEVNERACTDYGYSREEFLTMNIFDIEVEAPLRKQVTHAYDETEVGQVVEVHGTNKRKDGSAFPVEVRFTKLDDEFALAVVRDVTRSKRAEEALRRYESMVSASSDFMAFVDPTYTYQAVNPAYCDAHQKTQEEIVGRTVVEVIGQKLFETQVKPRLDRCLSGEQVNFELWWDSPGCGRLHIDVKYDPFYAADGSVAGVLVDIRDTTDREWVEEQIRRSRQELRHLAARQNEVREEERALVAREIHDELGQDLTGLKMDVSWFRDRWPADQRLVTERARLMEVLLDKTLAAVRRIAMQLRPAVLDELGLEAAIEWQTHEWTKHSGIEHDLRIEAARRAPEPACATAIFRVLQEALTNVARHAAATRVKVGLQEINGMLVLEVQDDGKGIADEAIASAQSVGLIGMRERVRGFGGRLNIRRAEEGGTVLTLEMPPADSGTNP